MKKGRWPIAAFAVALGSFALTTSASRSAGEVTRGAVDGARIVNAGAQDWLTHGRDYAEQRYSPLDRINAESVADLGLAWTFQFDTDRGQEATPIVVDGILYTTTSWSKVFAFDAASGTLLWSFDPKVPGRKGFDACCDVVNRGVAVWKGRVYFGTLDGRLIALDAASGKPVWSVMTVDPARPYTITGAPRVIRDKVLIGNGGAELGVRGYVSAYDAGTGNLVWRFYTAPNPQGQPDGAASDAIFRTVANATWGSDGVWKQSGGGGTVWDAIVYDAALNQVLIGVGNGSPWSQRVRSGDRKDNLFLSSVVALDPDTGAYKWHYQEAPGESWDFTATQPIILADLRIGGRLRQVLMHAPKNGFFFVIDRTTGRPISVKNYVPVNWADGYDESSWRPKERPEARYDWNGGDWLASPSAWGAHNWHPMAYSPKTGLVYIPVQLMPFGYAYDKDFKYNPVGWNLANASAQNIGPRTTEGLAAYRKAAAGELLAWDPVAQAPRWRVRYDGPGNGGVLATGGNLVFQGTRDGRFVAYRADTGAKIWSFQAQNGIIAGPIAYSVGGEQYIAVMAGNGGSAGVIAPLGPGYKPPNGRILVFKLGGTARLPAFQPVLAPANPPAQTWPAAVEDRGEVLFAGHCGLCHGLSTYSSGVVPDLRRSALLADKAGFDSVVVGGALEARGMISFAKILTADQIEAVRAYISKQARILKAEEAGGVAAKSR